MLPGVAESASWKRARSLLHRVYERLINFNYEKLMSILHDIFNLENKERSQIRN